MSFDGVEFEIHARPDLILGGLKPDIKWDRLRLIEIKSTTDWAIKKAKANPGVYYASWLRQLQLYMYLFGIKEGNILHGERNHGEWIMDDGDWPLIELDKGLVENEILSKFAGVIQAIDKGTPPPFGCTGNKKDFEYSSCAFNAESPTGCKGYGLP
jgi:hypothetical protein